MEISKKGKVDRDWLKALSGHQVAPTVARRHELKPAESSISKPVAVSQGNRGRNQQKCQIWESSMSDFRIERGTAEQGPAFRLRLIIGARSESETRSPLIPKSDDHKPQYL